MTTIGNDYLNLYKAKFSPYLLNMTAIENVILFATNSHPDIYLLEMTTIENS